MADLKIRKDKNSLFVLIDNNVYRPIHTKVTYKQYNHVAKDRTINTKFKHGEIIRAISITETDIASIRKNDGQYREIWFYHGTIITTIKKRKTSLCWKPNIA